MKFIAFILLGGALVFIFTNNQSQITQQLNGNASVIASKELPTIEETHTGRLKKQSYSVPGAYGLIPHGRTKFRSKEAQMSIAEAEYLKHIFHISDQIVVERVDLQIKHRQEKPIDLHNYTVLIHALNDLDAPKNLDDIKTLILNSAIEQRSYFMELKKTGNSFDARSSLVKTSSLALRKAYGMLMKQYPEETQHNIKAFFDHLCAMDFI